MCLGIHDCLRIVRQEEHKAIVDLLSSVLFNPDGMKMPTSGNSDQLRNSPRGISVRGVSAIIVCFSDCVRRCVCVCAISRHDQRYIHSCVYVCVFAIPIRDVGTFYRKYCHDLFSSSESH